MIDFFDCVALIKHTAQEQLDYSDKLIKRYSERDYLKLLSTAEKSTELASKQFLLHRELLLSMYELVPGLPETANISASIPGMLGIRMEQLSELSFPCYQITCPFLLPNKRKRNSLYNNAVTESVFATVKAFAVEHDIQPLTDATVIFVSYYKNDNAVAIDNDNKESIIITNALIGALLADDRPTACNTIYYSMRYSSPKTEIYIVDSKLDTEILERIKAGKV